MVKPLISIAVVDDEEHVLKAIRRLLQLADYHVMTYRSGEAFLESLQDKRPHCAVLDVHMPGLSGLDVEARIRRDSDELPIVFMTADDDEQVHRRILNIGRHHLLQKPLSNDQLLCAISGAMAGMHGGTNVVSRY